ncbi:MAG TPA: Rap1a/Tai family immunity protein [Acetobacteraceae bacterium]|nr:Rap1a/Tai family immunity protein [Acetobacteraceae bacterium]
MKYRLLAFALGAALCGTTAQAAVTQDSFLVRNTGDLVDLCTAPASDQLYTQAINFCHGFTVGVFRVLQEEDMATKSRHMFCLPDPTPTRNEGIGNFVKWAQADASRLAQPATDGIAAFLAQAHPCPRGR